MELIIRDLNSETFPLYQRKQKCYFLLERLFCKCLYCFLSFTNAVIRRFRADIQGHAEFCERADQHAAQPAEEEKR